MSDPFESKEPFKFTQYLRSKLRQQRGDHQETQLTVQQQMREIGKRNAQIKKSYELEKKGLLLNPFLFEDEANLMVHMRQSKNASYVKLYEQFVGQCRNLDKPNHLSEDYVLGRVYKFMLIKDDKIQMDPAHEKDYFIFNAMLQQKLDSKKMDELKFQCFEIHQHQPKILDSEQNSDFLEAKGFKYSDETFDDLYVKGYKEIVSTDSSEETEDNKEDIYKNGNDSKAKETKISKEDYITEPDQIPTQKRQNKVQSNMFDVDDEETKDDHNNNNDNYQYQEEEDVDLEQIEPHKVNWFKYILDKYLRLSDEEGNPTALNNADAYVNLLNIILSSKKNEEIQGELLDLVGFHNFEMLEHLISKRELIREHCKNMMERLQAEKQTETYRPKNMGPAAISIGVTVQRGNDKKNKKQRKGQADDTDKKISNYDLLRKLGFDKDLIEENKRLGLKEREMGKVGFKSYLLQHEEEKRSQAQVFEKNEEKKDYTITQEENDDWKFVQITPPPKPEQDKADLITIGKLPGYAQKAFGSATHLNRIQSIVYPIAFKTSKSLLVSAPTGAGKTNIALLTILREVSQHIEGDKDIQDMSLKQFKIIYIAPLKALASEIVTKFQIALAYLKIQVRELTGDMNLSKQEIQETHIIVSTPEKWDVVTRKTDGMMNLVNVMIIDEIHLLNDQRGLVLECLVARALMTGLKNQKPIRIVGLSATLPNYTDVAAFIGADSSGTFYFDASYRPTPLKCGFYGIKNLGNADRANKIMNDIIYTNLKRILKMGKQVIIFVHKRAETFNTAKELIEILQKKQSDMYLFDCEKSYTRKRDVQASRNEQLQHLFDFGFSVHHAGLLRKDRNLVESLFMEGNIKVLLSTATLAWGVNLPAYAVMIKGTKMYDSASGEYKDIGIFDVQQIFGRAGRPQFDNEGEALILTQFKQMDDYVKMMSNKQTIESNLIQGLDNCINAEIACGTIATLTEGVHWLKKSYFYQRLVKNPIAYGVKANEIYEDPSGHTILLEKMTQSVQRLNRMQLIRYNEQTDSVYSTDMGRIASNYYIQVDTMSYFMENLKPNIRDQIFLLHLANANEFKQLEARREEYEELQYLLTDIRFVEVDKACYNESYTKVLVLMEAYLRHKQLKTFSLISDMAYIVQNSARLLRAMFEIAMNKGYARLAKTALLWCHILDKRLKPDAHILAQFGADSHIGKLTNPNGRVIKYGYLKPEIIFRVNTADLSMEQLYNGEYDEINRYLSPYEVDELKKFVSYVPKIEMEVSCQPITRSILKVHLVIKANFDWNDRWNGKNEPFWIIVDNEEEILHSEFFLLNKKDAKLLNPNRLIKNEKEFALTFFIPYQVEAGENTIAPGTYYNLNIISDRWYNVNFWEAIKLDDIVVPDEDYPHTRLLKLRPLHISALKNEKFEELYSQRFKFFNPVQTQIFHTLYHTDSNVLIGAPTGSGKTIMSELAMLRVFKNASERSKVIYVAPLKALAKERIIDWKKRLQDGNLKKIVVELSGDFTPDIKALQKADVIITTPEKWDGISRNWQHRSYVQQVSLVIIDEIHLLGQERGPVIEVIVSRMRYISEQTGNNVRFVGLSTALANAKDVADWLGIHKLGLYNFKPSVRPVPIKVFFEGFSEKHYCPRMATMNKPAYKAIQNYSRNHPVLVFVSSRRQTRLTALDMISMSMEDQQSRGEFEGGDVKRPLLHMDPEEIHHISEMIRDEHLKQTIQFGVGMHHAGLAESDRKIVEDLFVKKKIQVLVTTSTLAWGVNFPARLVIIKGTEFFDPKVKRYVDFPLTDLLQMIGRAGRPQFDENGFACVLVHEEKKNFYKKFLYEPFPVESSLVDKIIDHLNAEIASGTLLSVQNCIDYLTWTYFFRRLTKNPAYYGLKATGADSINNYLKNLVNTCLVKLQKAGCIEYSQSDFTVSPTTLGHLASFYYLSYETIAYMKQQIKPEQNIGSLLNLLSNAREFFGLPVRHNEDILNEALTHLVPLKVPKHDLESPHVKANLLLQAHFERCPLPITDYITDTKSVLDQSIRVIQGMIDVAAHLGHLNTTLNLINMLQMILQGQWLDQSPFINIPNFDGTIIRKLADLGIMYLPQLIERCQGDIKEFFGQQVKHQMPFGELKEIYKALERVPVVELKYSIVSTDDRNEPLPDTPLEEGGEGLLTVNLKRTNRANKQKVLISHFPKAKDAAWFLIVGNPKKNDIIAIKRASFNRYATKTLSLALPDDFLEEKLELYLMCDSYIGIDQQYSIDLLQINGLIKGKKQDKEDSDEKGYYEPFGKLQEDMVDDILSDNDKQVKPAMHSQIKSSINNLLDSDGDENLDDDDYISDSDLMIEKDIDNWI